MSHSHRPNRRRSNEGGFVLLTLLFMAAAVAFTLAISLPRSAMQSQRTREETLIYRGEQYKRAVELYFRKYKKYPEDLDDLEESDGIRFLRRRYKDPLTGEDEWRLVHMGSNGRFKDSLIYDQEEEEEDQRGFGRGPGDRAQNRIGAYQGTTTNFQGADRARAARQSAAPDLPGQASSAEHMAAGFEGLLPEEGQPEGDDPAVEGEEQSQDGAGNYPNYASTLPSQIPSATGAGRQVPPNQAGVPGAVQPTLPTNRQSTNRMGGLRQRGARNAGGVAGVQPGAVPPGANSPGGFGAPGAGRSAADLIRNLITTPRPGGLAGLRNAQAGAQQANQASFSEGIAGVASKVEERGIKVYNDRENYNEWEFVYDYRQDASMAGMAGGAGGMGNINPGQPGIGPGGSLQVGPNQTAPVPGVAGFPGAGQDPNQPGAHQPGVNQPGAAQPGAVDPVTGQPVTIDPITGQPVTIDPATGQPRTNQPQDSRRRNNRRRRAAPPPLPGQSIYPVAPPTDPPLTPGTTQQPDPSQPPTPQN